MSQGVSSVQVVTSGLANLLLCYILKSDFEILWSVSCAEAQRGMVKGRGGGVVVQVQNLVSNWQKVLCLHSLRTEERNMW